MNTDYINAQYNRFSDGNFMYGYYEFHKRFCNTSKNHNLIEYGTKLIEKMDELVSLMKSIGVTENSMTYVGLFCGTINFICVGLDNIWNNSLLNLDDKFIIYYLLKIIISETSTLTKTEQLNLNNYIEIGTLIQNYNKIIESLKTTVKITDIDIEIIKRSIHKLTDLELISPIIVNNFVSINIFYKICDLKTCRIIGCFNKHKHLSGKPCILREEYCELISKSKYNKSRNKTNQPSDNLSNNSPQGLSKKLTQESSKDSPQGLSGNSPRGLSNNSPRGLSNNSPKELSSNSPQGLSSNSPKELSSNERYNKSRNNSLGDYDFKSSPFERKNSISETPTKHFLKQITHDQKTNSIKITLSKSPTMPLEGPPQSYNCVKHHIPDSTWRRGCPL